MVQEGQRCRHEILLIGPINAGKSTIGRLVSQRLGLPQVAVDAARWGYYEQIGYDSDHAAQLSGRHGFEGTYRYWKRFELYAVERILAEHADCVIDFGGGHSVYEDETLLERARRAVAPFHNVVLLLPAPDPEESIRLLRERSGRQVSTSFDVDAHFVRHPSNAQLATITVYTAGKTPEETAEEVLERATWAPEWRLPPDERPVRRTPQRATTLLHAAAHASSRHQDHATAERWLEEALSIRRELGGDVAEVLRALAAVDQALERTDQARERLVEALSLYEAAPQLPPPAPVHDLSPPPTEPPANLAPTGYARTLGNLGALERRAGRWEAARAWYERGLEAWRPFGAGHTAGVLKALCEAAREQGDFARAQEAYEQALDIYREQRHRPEIAWAQWLGGQLALAQGDLPAARDRFAEALSLRGTSRDWEVKSALLEGIACLAAAEGDAETALTLAGASTALRTAQTGQPPPSAASRAMRARYLDPAARSLSPEAATAATAAGEALSSEDAVARAAAYLER